jgi:RimJ/RimL family protein N-acetyltransferase
VAALRFPDPPLADGVVGLRPWREADLAARLTAFADPVLVRFSVPTTDEVTAASLRASLAAQEAARLSGEQIEFALVSPEAPEGVLGGGSVYDVNRGQARAAVGFWLTPQARGGGVATHATRLMARWAFETLRVERLELTCAPENEACQQVAGRCGFVREGVLRSHMWFKGQRRDTVVYSLLASELRR